MPRARDIDHDQHGGTLDDAAAPDVDLARVWLGIAASVWARPVGRLERLAGRLLGSPGLARALLTTPSLVLSWILASVVVLAIGAVVTASTGTPWVALLAPALAGTGIAYAYGPGVDPAWELSRTMAVSDRQVLLARAVAVFGLNAALSLIASLVVAGAVGLTLGWLLPMTAVSALALAVALWTGSAGHGVAAGLLSWGLVLLGSTARANDLGAAVTEAALIPVYLLVAAGGLALTVYAASRMDEGRWQWR